MTTNDSIKDFFTTYFGLYVDRDLFLFNKLSETKTGFCWDLTHPKKKYNISFNIDNNFVMTCVVKELDKVRNERTIIYNQIFEDKECIPLYPPFIKYVFEYFDLDNYCKISADIYELMDNSVLVTEGPNKGKLAWSIFAENEPRPIVVEIREDSLYTDKKDINYIKSVVADKTNASKDLFFIHSRKENPTIDAIFFTNNEGIRSRIFQI